MYSTTDFRKGLKIEIDGTPFEIIEFQHFKPGKGGAMVRTKLRNILNGRVLDNTFRSGEKVERPNLESRDMQFLYHEGEQLVFMDMTTYDQMHMDAEATDGKARRIVNGEDESFLEEILSAVPEIEAKEEKMRIEVLLSGEYDANNAILSFHPGAGGTEAQDWAMMLYRMYNRWAEKNGFTVKLIDWLDGDTAGIKSATIMVEGLNAYGFLKSENGVHRLVRVSPFDASGRRQTSFASVEVMPEFNDDGSIEIKDEDIEVTTHKSSGAGGQHINKTESAVRITHLPTGIVVGCQTERSQLQNKETALKMLKSKLMEIKLREHLDKIEDIQGTKANIEWGSQIRSYVFMPYTLAKDTRTGYEDPNISSVMDGNIDGFINAYLKMNA